MSPAAKPYLGDCPGEPVVYGPRLLPRAKTGWIERGVAAFIGWIAVFAFAFVLLIGIAGYLAMAHGKDIEWREYRVPAECRAIADAFGIRIGIAPGTTLLTRDQAFAALIKLENNRWWPGINQCLKAVNKEWRLR